MPSETLDSQPDTNLANLCQRCSEINLAWSPEAVRRLLSERSSSVIFGIEGSPSDAWAPSCTMCQLFKAIDPRKGDPMEVILQTPRSYDGQGAVGFAANSSLLLKVKSTDAPFYTGRHLSVQSDPTQPIKLVDPQHIDLHTINGWLSTCLDNHKHLCSLDFYPEICGLRVIDVRTKKIEVAERCTRYVALSYVWGQPKQNPPVVSTPEPATTISANQPSQEKDNLDCLPNNLPSTILDAMTMTASLGFQYLWVDRYCIPQGESNSNNRDEQIRQMDKVYRNAEITICAAAGEGPEHGLPGVGSIARVPQAHARIGNHTLISTMHDPIRFISSTKWASRGWTYQEAICSRRRLVFTDEQVFFECQKMSCRETADYIWPLKLYSIFNRHNSVGMDAKWFYITRYTGRQLTYDSDALNALLGVLRLRLETGFPVVHFWGIPMTLRSEDRDGDGDGDSSTSDSRRLQETFLQSLSWKSWTPGRRRPDFPTWSWTAWACSVEFSHLVKCEGFELLHVAVSIGYDDGSFRDIEYAYRHNFEPYSLSNLSNTLGLRGRVLKLMTKVLQNRSRAFEEHELFAWPEDQHEQYGDVQIAARAVLLQEMDAATMASWQKEPVQLFGILMGYYGHSAVSEIFVILLSKVATGKYQRVGHAILDSGYSSNMYSMNVVTDNDEDMEVEERVLRTERWVTDSTVCDIDLV